MLVVSVTVVCHGSGYILKVHPSMLVVSVTVVCHGSGYILKVHPIVAAVGRRQSCSKCSKGC